MGRRVIAVAVLLAAFSTHAGDRIPVYRNGPNRPAVYPVVPTCTAEQQLRFGTGTFACEALAPTWTEPSPLLNGWVNFGAPFNNAGYYKDPQGRVFLKGLVKSGSISTTLPIFTLPVGYRPAGSEVIVTISNGAIGRITVQADGDVIAENGSNVWFSLDNASFLAVP